MKRKVIILSVKLFCATALLAGSFAVAPEGGFAGKERAKYICGFIRQITWRGNETALVMGVLEKSSELSSEMMRQAIPANLRDKKLTVQPLSSIDSLPPLHILYINKNWHPDVNIDSLRRTLRGKGTLLITEAGVFRHSMINFVAVDSLIYYEVNEQALKDEGFTYMQVLPFGAVKNREDWELLFRETRRELREEKEVTAQQRHEIDVQQQEIARQQQKMAAQEKAIAMQVAEIDRQQTQLASLAANIVNKQHELAQQEHAIVRQEEQIAQKQREIDEQNRINTRISSEITAKQTQIGTLSTQLNRQLAQLKMQHIIILLGSLLIALLAVFGIAVFVSYRQKKRINRELEIKNREITEQRDRIAHQNEEITEQRDHIARQNREITDSILYARRIQNAVLPERQMLKNDIDMFIFYRPRDIVSGDFYWMSKLENKLVIVAADCTGHGVPGAFMSMLGVAFLNEIVSSHHTIYANEILNRLRENVITSLGQTGKSVEIEAKDGMDIALCIIDRDSMTLQYAGANNPLILIRNGELQVVKADKMPVAYSDHGRQAFTNNLISLVPGDAVYIFSDGYADQFGGEHEKKYSSRQLKQSLLEVHQLPIAEQERLLAQKYDKWKGDHEQVDDVLLMGMRV
ncbi:MAG: YfiR/HmsC family protein [Cytophagaceae bacterium]|jgi:serine phosphatase RsbU (regulator of sigma subunit)|nr:YfiR/HmsC family protein [Cytophagaceae bacterium]